MTERLAADRAGIERAAWHLREGRLVAFPTETVYGLGADARQGPALAALFAAKGRPRFNPLIVHLADAARAADLALVPPFAARLARDFWPGPLTLVLRRRPDSPVHPLASAGLDTLALRVPAHPAARALLAAFGGPLAAPSANRSGRLSPTEAGHVQADLDGRIAAILDAGPCPVGIESTVLDLSTGPPALLRPGAVPAEALAAFGIVPAEALLAGPPRAPGLLLSHYAPDLPVRLEAPGPVTGEAYLGFGPMPPGLPLARNLSPAGDLAEAAAALFGTLRDLDAAARQAGLARIAVAPIPQTGLGRAINDRLRRAAAPRPPETLEAEPG